MRRVTGSRSRRVIAQRKVLAAQNFKSARVEHPIEVRRTEVVEMARHVHAVPGRPEQEELPASCVGNLDDQPAPRPEQLMRRLQIRAWLIEMLQHVKHGHCRAALRWKWGAGE